MHLQLRNVIQFLVILFIHDNLNLIFFFPLYFVYQHRYKKFLNLCVRIQWLNIIVFFYFKASMNSSKRHCCKVTLTSRNFLHLVSAFRLLNTKKILRQYAAVLDVDNFALLTTWKTI